MACIDECKSRITNFTIRGTQTRNLMVSNEHFPDYSPLYTSIQSTYETMESSDGTSSMEYQIFVCKQKKSFLVLCLVSSCKSGSIDWSRLPNDKTHKLGEEGISIKDAKLKSIWPPKCGS